VKLSLTVRTVIVAALAVLALLLALTGVDVLRWRGQLERGQVALAARSADPAIWEPHTVIPRGVSRWVLRAAEGVGYARAVQHYELARRSRGLGFLQSPVLPTAQLALLRFGQGDSPEADRSHALTMYGVLLYGGMSAQDISVVIVLSRTIEQFRKAIELDPTNGAAKFDLEYILRLAGAAGGLESVGMPPRRSSRGQRAGAGSPGTALPGGGF
jgi:hypothetical protein